MKTITSVTAINLESKNNEQYSVHLEDEASEGHRLNHVYQGSLRETGSTLRPRHNGDGYSNSYSPLRNHKSAIWIFLIISYHLTRYT